jgi:hypothetical protein
MVHFQTKNLNLSKFWTVLQWNIFRAILSILQPNGIFYGHLVHFAVIRYIFPRFGMLYREKSGNPAPAAGSKLQVERVGPEVGGFAAVGPPEEEDQVGADGHEVQPQRSRNPGL